MARRLLLFATLSALVLCCAAAGLLLAQARAAPPARPGEEVALLGVAELSGAGGPHWELLVPRRVCTISDPAGRRGPIPSRCFLSFRRYVLLGAVRPRDGWLCWVRGRISEGPNPWRLPAIEAERAVPLAPIFWALRRSGDR